MKGKECAQKNCVNYEEKLKHKRCNKKEAMPPVVAALCIMLSVTARNGNLAKLCVSEMEKVEARVSKGAQL
eukprot:491479-Ditylum_brightwellii.AAC.1